MAQSDARATSDHEIMKYILRSFSLPLIQEGHAQVLVNHLKD